MKLAGTPEYQLLAVGQPIEGGCVAVTARGLLIVPLESAVYSALGTRFEVFDKNGAIEIRKPLDEGQRVTIWRGNRPHRATRTTGDRDRITRG